MGQYPHDKLIRTGTVILFFYMNRHGKRHNYEVLVESIEFGAYSKDLGADCIPSQEVWVLHGWVISRDGSIYSEMDPNRRRTFLLNSVEDLKVSR